MMRSNSMEEAAVSGGRSKRAAALAGKEAIRRMAEELLEPVSLAMEGRAQATTGTTQACRCI
jgi:hypothetical protein